MSMSALSSFSSSPSPYLHHDLVDISSVLAPWATEARGGVVISSLGTEKRWKRGRVDTINQILKSMPYTVREGDNIPYSQPRGYTINNAPLFVPIDSLYTAIITLGVADTFPDFVSSVEGNRAKAKKTEVSCPPTYETLLLAKTEEHARKMRGSLRKLREVIATQKTMLDEALDVFDNADATTEAAHTRNIISIFNAFNDHVLEGGMDRMTLPPMTLAMPTTWYVKSYEGDLATFSVNGLSLNATQLEYFMDDPDQESTTTYFYVVSASPFIDAKEVTMTIPDEERDYYIYERYSTKGRCLSQTIVYRLDRFTYITTNSEAWRYPDVMVVPYDNPVYSLGYEGR